MAKRFKVLYGTWTPRRANSTWILVKGTSALTQPETSCRFSSKLIQARPHPSLRAGRTSSQIRPTASSLNWSKPPSRLNPIA